MDAINTKRSFAARYAKWLIRKQPGGSPKARKILAWVCISVGMLGLVTCAITQTERMYYIGGCMIILGILNFQLAGFVELLNDEK